MSSYHVKRGRWMANGRLLAVVCPRCGRFFDLAREAIDSTGKAIGEVHCPGDGCEFRAQIKLAGWRERRTA